jgi:protein-S-isoprenylcysteine O-methyltransferase
MSPSAVFLVVALAWWASELWIDWRKRSIATAERLDRGSLRLLSVVIYVCIALGAWLSWHGIGAFPAPWRARLLLAGIGLMLAGMAFRAWAITVLARQFTVDVSIRPDHELIQRGPYRWLRHPSYTGALATFTGFALGLGSVIAAVVVIVPVTLAFLHRIRVEEAALTRAFPDDYPAYAARTKRLLPWLW